MLRFFLTFQSKNQRFFLLASNYTGCIDEIRETNWH